MLRARGVSRGKRVPPVYGEADRRPVRVQRSRATGVPGEALDAEPVQEDVGSLSVEAENVERSFQGRPARALRGLGMLQAPVHPSLDVADVLGHDRVRRVSVALADRLENQPVIDRKSTRLNSSHEWISYAVFCLK